MNIRSFLEILSNDSQNPCCFADMDSGEILFLNRSLIKLLKQYENHSTEEYYDLVEKNVIPCNHIPKQPLLVGEFVEQYVYNEALNKNFLVNNTLLQVDGRNINLSKYLVKPVYSNEQISFEEAMAETTEILSQEEIEMVLESFLRLLGQFYQCEKAILLQGELHNSRFVKRNAWYQKSEANTIEVLDDPSIVNALEDLYEHAQRNGIIQVNTIGGQYKSGSVEFEFFKHYHISDLVICPLIINKKFAGIVCVCNRAEMTSDYRLLKAVTRFIEESLGKSTALSTMKTVSERDTLTGLFRRKKYAETLQELEKKLPITLGVVFANINGLRKINETYSVEEGDRLLVRCAKKFKEFFPEPTYRVGGDEFLCFLINTSEEDFLQRVEEIQSHLAQIEEPLFSIGYSWRSPARELSKLVAEAEALMYINKQDYYKQSHGTLGHIGNEVLKDLLSALDDEEFTVYLQPQFRLDGETVTGAEALIRRFRKTTGEMVFPDSFIPLYEQNSVIRHVDLFVVERVCQLLSQWGKEGKVYPISVNLSRVTLLEYNIPRTIATICDKYQIPHHLIVIEVTERVGLIENNVASALIDQFMSLGFPISLDDFGCAYSNIVTLVKISVDEIKIDKSLVDDILISEKNQIIVGNLLNMCNSFQNTSTLAEGIEYPEQAEILREYGCTYGQGYYFSKPIPAEEFYTKYVKEQDAENQ
ncbi:MAG: bifunctional diguanylate cyclase/phosphodiesterase [Eubacteriales bacterium]